MIELMVICIFLKLFGASILAFLGNAGPVAVHGAAAVPSGAWLGVVLWVVVVLWQIHHETAPRR